MKRLTPLISALLLMGILVMTGCEKDYTKIETTESEKETTVETETETETQAETTPTAILESVEADQVMESSMMNQSEFESSLGYSVIYDKTLFEYNRTGDYDELVLKGQTFSSKPLVFFAAMELDSDEVEAVVKEIFDDSAVVNKIGSAEYEALCQPTVEAWSDGKGSTYHDQYLVRLMNGKALLFEVQWYEEAATEPETTVESEAATELETAVESESSTEAETMAQSESSTEMVEKTDTAVATESESDAEDVQYGSVIADMMKSLLINEPVQKISEIPETTEAMVLESELERANDGK